MLAEWAVVVAMAMLFAAGVTVVIAAIVFVVAGLVMGALRIAGMLRRRITLRISGNR